MPKNTYHDKEGNLLVGCTTVVNQIAKGDALLNWAWKCGKMGKDWQEERDSAGDIGTQVHEMIMNYWKRKDVAIEGEVQERCFSNFFIWLKDNKVEPILIEQPLVSEVYKFGGQPDLYAYINNKPTLLDIKTSKAVYETFWYQLGGYNILLRVNGYNPKQYQILRLGQDGSFEAPIRTDLTVEKQIFKHLLKIYQLRQRR